MAEAAAAKLAEEAVVGCVNQIKHQFKYLSQYHQNMANLNTKVKNLEARRVDVQDKVSIATENCQTIKEDVIAWLGTVKGIKEDAEEVLKEKDSVGSGCWKGWCVDMNKRYSLSKMAMNKAIDLETFLDEGVFETVAHLKRALAHVPSEINPATSEDYLQAIRKSESSSMDVDGRLESRLLMLNNVMTAIKNPQIRIIRICGMGGIGKTTMAKEVKQMATKERLFREIAMVEVSRDPDVKTLQLHIAEWFGLKLEEDNVSARAERLRKRLSGKGPKEGGENRRILLILDNVWAKEDLEKAGIPLEDENSHCKIVLTSRSDVVCKDIAPEAEFNVEVLSYPESLFLFKQTLGNASFYDPNIAEDLVKACGGLPISVTTIAGALKIKTKEEDLKFALSKLKRSDLKGEYAPVFKCLQVSYDFLENEEIKKFFRLCCLFSKGSDVPIEELVRYGMALRLFNDPDKLYDARYEAHSYVETLLHSNLLLPSDKESCFKVHDHVWDFAMSASSNDLFMVNHGDGDALTKWPKKDSYENYTLISLRFGKMFQVPKKLDCPNLKLLELVGDKDNTCSLEFPEMFFKGMDALNVLVFKSMIIPLTLKSLLHLRDLRSLSLCQCSVGDVSMIGDLGMLEVLIFAGSKIKELPREIAELKELRLLDLTGCDELCVIAPGVFSQLSSLEELYMRGTNFRNQALFSEISSMSTLGVLDIEIPAKVLPMDLLFSNLKRFRISLNEEKLHMFKIISKIVWKSTSRRGEDKYLLQNCLELYCESSTLLQHGIKWLLQEAVRMYLTITGLKSLLPLNNSNGLVPFSKVKNLRLESCNGLVCLVNTMGNQNIIAPFHNLKILEVYRCHELEYIFTVSVARGLGNLEKIKIRDCERLKVIFGKGSDSEGKVELPNLKYLSLEVLPKLIGCCNAGDNVDFPKLEKLKLKWIPLISSLIQLEEETSASDDNGHPFINHKGSYTFRSFRSLTSLKVKNCDSIRHICTPSMALSFGELQYLKVYSCNSMQAIVAEEDRKEEEEEEKEKESGTEVVLLLPKLIHLHLRKLHNLSTILPKGYTLSWPSLKTIGVYNCGKDSEVLFSEKNNKQRGITTRREIALTSLEVMFISGVGSLELLRKHFPIGFSYEFRDTSVSELPVLFSTHLIRGFHNLREMFVYDLKDDFEVVFDLGEECIVGDGPKVAMLNNLDSVYIYRVHNMTRVWKNVNKNFQGFCNLTSLEVIDCGSLRYLFSPSIAKCLVKLQYVIIENCKMIEEVISKRDEDGEEEEGQKRVVDTINFFPQLQKMSLEKLPSLMFLGPRVYDLDKLSNLEPPILHHDINATSSSSISTFIFAEKFQSLGSSASVALKGVRFSWSLHSLTELEVIECHNQLSLFPPNIQVRLPSLRSLSIKKCNNLKYLFSSSTVRSLEVLRDLVIIDCKMMKVIVKDEEGEEETEGSSKLVFPSLESLTLEFLPNLEGICLGRMLDFEWPSLKYVRIHICSKMRIFTSGYSAAPILDNLLINSIEYSLAEGGGDLNITLTSAVVKMDDNIALKEEGILPINGFLLAGDHLVSKFPCWSWESPKKSKWGDDDFPAGREYLIRRKVACLKRARPASSRLLSFEDDKNEEDHVPVDEMNIQKPRTYDIIIDYAKHDKCPLFWVKGYDVESETGLPLELVLQDIAEFYPPKFVTIKKRRHEYPDYVYLDGLRPNFIKDFFNNLIQQGFQPNVENYFQLLLDSLFPTIESCVC